MFAGTPDFAVPSLGALTGTGHKIVAVYTQPDRPAGRGRKLRKSAVRQAAESLTLPVVQPPTLRDEPAQQQLAELRPDLVIVAAYGLILPQAVLDLPRLGCVNVHASLLPRWRGAAPVHRAILAGDNRTGVTLMQMNAGLDTGDMLAKRETPIDEAETGGELTERLAHLGAALLADELDNLVAGRLESVPQDDTQATHAPKIRKSEALIDWDDTAAAIARKVRAFNPWPVAETRWNGRQLRLWSAWSSGEAATAKPGTVTAAADGQLRVATAAGELVVSTVQPEGKRVMPVHDFLNANHLLGDVLGG